MNLQLIVFSLLLIEQLVLCDDSEKETRILKVELNPGCKGTYSSCDSITFVYIQAESSKDIIHYVWDFTGIPSLLLANTDKNVSLIVNWNDFMNSKESVHFNTTRVNLVSSLVIKRVIMFNDIKDSGNINDPSISDVTSYNPHVFTWNKLNLTQFNDQHVMLVMNASLPGTNGTFAIKLSVFGSSDHGEELPHLYHSAHSMQMDIVVSNIASNYTNPRVALEFLMVSSQNKSEGGNFSFFKRQNLDDEYTPGIFDVHNIVTPGLQSHMDFKGAFLQYRPLCYTTKDRTVSGSTEMKQGEIIAFGNSQEDIEEFRYTLPFSYFGYSLGTKLADSMNMTFGKTGDGFFTQTNYTSFSMLMGFGEPPVEKLSTFVLTFAAVGLGVPLIVMVFGGFYVALKRYRS